TDFFGLRLPPFWLHSQAVLSEHHAVFSICFMQNAQAIGEIFCSGWVNDTDLETSLKQSIGKRLVVNASSLKNDPYLRRTGFGLIGKPGNQRIVTLQRVLKYFGFNFAFFDITQPAAIEFGFANINSNVVHLSLPLYIQHHCRAGAW